MKLFKKVAIIGTGLIGGSLGLAIKKRKIADKVIGIGRHRQTLALAKRRQAIDISSQDLNIVKDADLIILATPVKTILNIAQRIYRIVEPKSIVIDVGSTKKEIVLQLQRLFPRFIGSHPLAGSEKRGMLNANADIFNNSVCILTPTKSTHGGSLRKVKKFWQLLGAEAVCLKPSLHDDILSFISHLPHLIAFCLIAAIPRKYLNFVAPSFKDTTRIASSDATVWRDIFLSNRKSILLALKAFQDYLSKMEDIIRKKDARRLEAILKKAKVIRDSLK